MALTLWPNSMAPKPQANPVKIAIQTGLAGACERISQLCGAVMLRIAAGISRHETRMNRAHTFSQSHRPRKRIGSVKLPFITPDNIARNAPATTMLLIPSALRLLEQFDRSSASGVCVANTHSAFALFAARSTVE